MFDILSWNIRQGGGSRINKIANQLIKFSPEVIVLSEFRNNEKGSLLRTKLLRAGYLHQIVGHDSSHKNTVFIASKIIFDGQHCRDADEIYKSAILKVEFDAFNLYGMYLPHKKKHKLFDYLVEQLKSDKPSIMVGDFNTGVNYIDQKSNSFMYSEYLNKFKDLGNLDAYRLIHGDTKVYSWYSHKGNGFRYDHSYIHEDLKPLVKDCFYLHSWRDAKLSDHSPMILKLG